jgi:hypothetical protein
MSIGQRIKASFKAGAERKKKERGGMSQSEYQRKQRDLR